MVRFERKSHYIEGTKQYLFFFKKKENFNGLIVDFSRRVMTRNIECWVFGSR